MSKDLFDLKITQEMMGSPSKNTRSQKTRDMFDLRITQEMMGSPSKNKGSGIVGSSMESPNLLEKRSKENDDRRKGRKRAMLNVHPVSTNKEKRSKNNEDTMLLKKKTNFIYQHRCVVSAYKKLVDCLNIDDSVMRVIDSTPFSHLFSIPSCRINITELNKLMSQLDVNNNFILGASTHRFTVDDVASILCIPNSGMQIIEHKNKTTSTALELMFAHERPSRWRLEKICEDMKNKNENLDVTTRAHLWLLSLFTTFLLPDSGTGVHHSIVTYINNIDQLSHYNWAEYIHRVILFGITSGRRYCVGCAWALMVWAYQRNPNLQPPNPEETVPFKQWCRMESNIENILSCADLPVSENTPPSHTKPKRKTVHHQETIKNLEKEVENLKKLLDEQTEKYQVSEQQMKKMVEENNELKRKISDLLGEKRSEQNPPKTVPSVAEPSSLVKRIKKRTVKRFAEKKKEIHTDATGETVIEGERVTIDKPSEHKEAIEKQTKVYRSRRSKQADQTNTCTSIVQKETAVPTQTEVEDQLRLNVLMAGSHADPEEYVSRFLSNKKFL